MGDIRLKRALSIDNLNKKKYQSLTTNDEWQALIGEPELKGSWIIFGDSGNGKTTFALNLAKHLSKFKKVAYNSLEEGTKLSISRAIKRVDFTKVADNFRLLQGDSYKEINERCSKQKSADVFIIDSIQYFGIDKKQYKKLLIDHPTKLFIFISHAEGKLPQGTTAKAIRFDADVKIRVEGYKAFCMSRFGGGEPYIIWKEGSDKYWNKK